MHKGYTIRGGFTYQNELSVNRSVGTSGRTREMALFSFGGVPGDEWWRRCKQNRFIGIKSQEKRKTQNTNQIVWSVVDEWWVMRWWDRGVFNLPILLKSIEYTNVHLVGGTLIRWYSLYVFESITVIYKYVHCVSVGWYSDHYNYVHCVSVGWYSDPVV